MKFILLFSIFLLMNSCFYNTEENPIDYSEEIFNLNIVQNNLPEKQTANLSLNQKSYIKPDKVKKFTFCSVNYYKNLAPIETERVNVGNFLINYDENNYLFKPDYETIEISPIKDNQRVEIDKTIVDKYGKDHLFFDFPSKPKLVTDLEDFSVSLDKEVVISLSEKYFNTMVLMTFLDGDNSVDVICKYKNLTKLVVPENVMDAVLKASTTGHISVVNIIDEKYETYSGTYRYILKNQVSAKLIIE